VISLTRGEDRHPRGPYPLVDIVDYFLHMQTELRRRTGLEPIAERYSEDVGSDGASGLVEAIVPLTDGVRMRIYELVEIVDGRYPRRTRYAYVLIVGGVHHQSWELDDQHDHVPIHEHIGPGRHRVPAAEVTFVEALSRAWKLLS
jgi:hypothetical protein